MINLIHAEFYKLRKSLTFKLGLLATLLCAVLLSIISNGVATGKMDINISSVSGLCDIFIMSVLGSLLAGSIICTDFDNKNIHDAVSCGRRAIVSSKVVIYCIVVGLLTIPYALMGLIGFLTQGEFAAEFNFSTYTMLMANAGGLSLTSSNIGKAVFLSIVSIVVLVARLSICIPIAFKIRKSVVVTVVGVIFSFVVDFIMDGISKIPVLGDIVDYLPYKKTTLTMDMSVNDLIQTLICSIVFIIIMAIVTYVSFRKAEIK